MSDKPIPTLYAWTGSNPAVYEALVENFYDKAIADDLLEPVFAGMSPEHRQHVAIWFVEIFGGAKTYSTELGGHAHMVSKHLNLKITEAQRQRWTHLMAQAADEVGLPTDPEFRSAFVAYVEWGTRMALMYSQAGQKAPSETSPMPTWGWGEVKPYMPED